MVRKFYFFKFHPDNVEKIFSLNTEKLCDGTVLDEILKYVDGCEYYDLLKDKTGLIKKLREAFEIRKN